VATRIGPAGEHLEASLIGRAWRRWVERCHAATDLRPLALVRIGVGLCIAGDLLQAAKLGLVRLLWTPIELGGLSPAPPRVFFVGSLIPMTHAGPVLWAVTLLCALLITLGVFVRPAIVIGVIAFGQLAHLNEQADRTIDRLLRTVLLVLLFSDAHRRFALAGGPAREDGPAWPQDLIRWLLFLVYTGAGVGKLLANAPSWLGLDAWPALYRVMTDPLGAWFDPVAWQNQLLPFRLGGIATILIECSAFLVLTRFAPWWALAAVPLHLGIWVSMKLGMFSWGMLALYPVLLAPWICAALDRWPPTARRSAT
jgi:hypothetical protein